VLANTFSEMVKLLGDVGTGDEQAATGARYRLPRSLGSGELMRWDTRGQTGLKNGVGPIAPPHIVRIVNIALGELRDNYGGESLNVAGLYGAKTAAKLGRKIIVIGNSHAKRLVQQLREAGEDAVHLETPHFRAISKMVQQLSDNLATLVDNLTSSEVVILFHMFDNSFYKARCEDGSLIPICRRVDGSYHIDGDLVTIPQDNAKQTFMQLFPVFKRFQDYCKMVAVPIPRYLRMSCCMDADHGANIFTEEHVTVQMGELANTQKLWRGVAFRERLKNIKVVNASHLLEEATWWGGDPVHPTTTGYDRLANFMVTGFTAMIAKQEASVAEEEVMETPKRPLDSSSIQHSAAKRPAWLSSNEQFVTRSYDQHRGHRGRGRGYRGSFYRGSGGGGDGGGSGTGGRGWGRYGGHRGYY
jgi:uncharacterized membrane protein YgcG